MPVYLIRHPVPQIASGICYGQSDLTVDVTEREAVLARLLPQLPSYCHIMTSPLRRCADLATALCGALAATANSGEATMVPQSDPRLMELNFEEVSRFWQCRFASLILCVNYNKNSKIHLLWPIAF